MEKFINVYKKEGETPLDCINTLKKERPELGLLPMTYAGRLDPLAEGVLLILVGEECKKKDEYLNLPKEYEVEILFGFATDTYDVMGKILEYETPSEILFKRSSDEGDGSRCQTILNSTSDYVSKIQGILPNFIGKIKQKYPPYSSRPVKGKPLFEWAREDKLEKLEIPEHDVFIESINIIGENSISGEKLLKGIKDKILRVKGDFRQEEILSLWQEKLKDREKFLYPVIKLKISCGSGVYMRGIAQDIGKKLGVPALALKIIRTRIGEYSI